MTDMPLCVRTGLPGLSIDSHYAQLARVRNRRDRSGVAIPFLINAALSREVAHRYGLVMLLEGAVGQAGTGRRKPVTGRGMPGHVLQGYARNLLNILLDKI